MVGGKYKFDDKGIRALTSAVSKLGATRVRVGVLGAKADEIHPRTGGTLTIGELAAIQEFGTETTDHIPERSFIRRTLNDLVWLRVMAARAAERVVFKRESAEQALDWLGNVLVNAIQNTISQGVPPPNKPDTIAWKGHAHTLVGLTSVLRDSISHEVVTGGSDTSVEY
jgi:hypothetical protein